MSNKNRYLTALIKNGDSIVTLRKPGISEPEHICCTIDFDNKYIKQFKKGYVSNFNKTILVFSWTDNGYRVLDPEQITNITPLEKILNNG